MLRPIFLTGLFLALTAPALARAAKGTVLVVLSSESKITLKDGKTHPTGFYLVELMGPAKRLLDAGYELEFASPKGGRAVMDRSSDDPKRFKDAKEYIELR